MFKNCSHITVLVKCIFLKCTSEVQRKLPPTYFSYWASVFREKMKQHQQKRQCQGHHGCCSCPHCPTAPDPTCNISLVIIQHLQPAVCRGLCGGNIPEYIQRVSPPSMLPTSPRSGQQQPSPLPLRTPACILCKNIMPHFTTLTWIPQHSHSHFCALDAQQVYGPDVHEQDVTGVSLDLTSQDLGNRCPVKTW